MSQEQVAPTMNEISEVKMEGGAVAVAMPPVEAAPAPEATPSQIEGGVAAAPDERATILMGGTGCESQGNRATESSVRGVGRAWRAYTGY